MQTKLQALKKELEELRRENTELKRQLEDAYMDASASQESAVRERLLKLSNIFELLTSDSEENIRILVRHTAELLGGACSLYNRLDDKSESLVTRAEHNAPKDLLRHDTPEGHICYEATIKGKDRIVIIEELKKTPYEQSDNNVRKYGLRSYLGYPVHLSGRAIGSLCIVDTKPRKFSQDEIHIISTLAKALSMEEERQMAIRNQQKSQQSYINIFNSVNEGIFVHDKDNGAILDINQAVTEMYGYTREEVLSLSVEHLSARNEPYTQVQVKAWMEKAINAGPQSFEWQARAKDGRVFWVNVQLKFATIGGADRIIALVRDIDAQKKAERSLAESTARYRLLFDEAIDYLLLIDPFHEEGPVIIDANPAACANHGYTREEMIGMPVAYLDDEDSRKKIKERVQGVLSGENVTFEAIHQRKDGSKFPVEVSAKLVATPESSFILAVERDISEKKKSEQELAQSEARFRTLIEHSPAGSALIDVNYTFIYVNPKFASICGYDANELNGRDFRIVLDDFSKKIVSENYRRRQRGEKVATQYEFHILRKDGLLRSVEISSTVISTAANQPMTIAQISDITEKKKIEMALRESEAKFKSILAHSHAAILLIDDSYQIVYANKQIRKISGFRSQEIIGKDIRKLVGIELVKRFDLLIRGKNKTSVSEISLKTKLGKERWIENRSSVYTSSNGQLFLVVQLLDVTNRKQAEKALMQSEQKYRQLVDNSLVGIYITQQHILRYCNQPFAHIFGYYNAQELIGTHVKQLIAPESWPIVKREVEQREKHVKSSSHYEFRAIKKDGSIFEVEVLGIAIEYDGKPAVQGSLLDITERKKAESALVRSEQQYRQLFNSLPYGGEVLDKDGYVLTCSKNTERLTGYTPSEMIGKHITDILTPASKKIFKEQFPNLLSGRPISAEICLIHKNGEEREVLRAGQPIFDVAGNIAAILAINVDITEQKRIQKALNESEQRFKAVFNQSKACMLLVEPGEEQKIIDANRAAIEFYGYSYEQFLGMTMAEINTLPAEKRQQLMKQAINNPSNYFEFKHRLASSEVRDVEVYASPIAMGEKKIMYVIVHDITERKKASEEVSRLATVVAQSDESVMITNMEGAIQYVNRAFEEISGFPEQEVLGKNPRILKSGKHDDSFYENMRQTIGAGSKWQGLFVNKNKNGQIFYLKTSILPIKNDEGEIINFAAIGRDVTRDRIREEQLSQAQKMEAIGTLSGGIAHDFNNLLTVINGHAEVALMKIAPQDKVHRDLISILNAGKRAERLTSQLLAFSRKQVHQLKILDMNLTISELDKMIRRLIPEDIEIISDYGENLPFIKADPTQLEQIVINLIINARDAIRMNPEEGAPKKITICTQAVDLDDLFVSTHPASSTGPHILLKVCDTGIGMDEDVRSRIFEPFFTTKEVGKGTGLGLSTVYGIVKQNNGFIHIDSTPGEGSTFSIYWPVTQGIPENEQLDEASTSSLSGTETILFVEDDEGVRNFACSALKSFGYKVIEANRPQNALKITRKKNQSIDMLITDLVMPGINGKELAERLSGLIELDKTLFVSGYSMDYISREGELQEGIHFLQKPYSVKQLLQKIREILDKQDKTI